MSMTVRKNHKAASGVIIAAALITGLICGTTMAQGLGNLGGKLGGMLGGGSGGSLPSGSMGNVAGLLQYCEKNNYLSSNSGAAGIAGKLLGQSQGGTGNADYVSGMNGILKGSDGHSTNLATVGGGNSDLKSKIATKACGVVLKQGQHFLGH